MKCSRCKKSIQGAEIKFAVEGEWMGKPLCRKCTAKAEKEARERYQKGLAKQHSVKNHYGLNVYRLEQDDELS